MRSGREDASTWAVHLARLFVKGRFAYDPDLHDICQGMTAVGKLAVSGFTPGGSRWKVSLVVTLNPGENSAPTRPAAA